MGKISILTKDQRVILNQIAKNAYIKDRFYLTGGTALSEFYLHHRYSDDLDFFTEDKYDTLAIFNFINDLRKQYRFSFESELIEYLYRFTLTFPDKSKLKMDFSYYRGKRVKKGILFKGIVIDSLLDIAINKISTITSRYEVKDFVDFYFLVKKFGFWHLREGAMVKFRMEIEPWIFAADLLYAEKFDTLPRMIKPLTLPKLQEFFRNLSKQLGKKRVE